MRESASSVNRQIAASRNSDRRRWRKMGGKNYNFHAIIALVIICLAWTVAAHIVDQPFIFPYFEDVIAQVLYSLTDLYVLEK